MNTAKINPSIKKVPGYRNLGASAFGTLHYRDKENNLKSIPTWVHPETFAVLAKVFPNSGEACVKPVFLLVAEAFLDRPRGYQKVIQRDGNPAHTAPSNLEWIPVEAAEVLAHDITEEDPPF